MKLKIPPANKVFKKNRMPPKPPEVGKMVMDWLNTEVFDEIVNTEPHLSPKSLKVTGRVTVEVPFEYSTNPREFQMLTKAYIVPLGYDIEFTYSGDGVGRDICIVTWEQNL